MSDEPALVYCASVIVLLLKYLATITVQARERLTTRRFRYAEDAAHWAGCVGEDSDLCQRAQSLLRNDTESQPFFLALGAAYVALGLSPALAPWYFGGYSVSRCAHALWLLRAKQPWRNRAFAAGLTLLFVLGTHVLVAIATS